MRKFKVILITVIATFAMLFPGESNAQVRLGLKFGISTVDIKTSDLIILNPQQADQFRLAIENAEYGVHGGLMLQVFFGNFFLQPEVIFNSNSVDFQVEDLEQGILIEDLKNENYQNLDIPLMMGFAIGPLRLGAGPVAHYFLKSSSELFEFSGYEQKFDDLTYGWQAGIGLDLWNVHIDLRYEGNFSDFGDHITWHGKKYAFSDSPSRFLLSLGISF